MRPQVQSRKSLRSLVATMIGIAAFVLGLAAAAASAQVDPAVLQKRGIAKVTQYVDNFRRTGDRASLLPQLRQAQDELTASYTKFAAAGDFASAALSLLSLGDIERMQDHWAPAAAHYDRARVLAGQADNHGDIDATKRQPLTHRV